MAINLHLLRVFYTVIEAQSFSRAADRLFISQPAVSKAVRELERQLDLALIERGARISRGVQMTEGGAALHAHARSIFALERSAVDDIRARVGLQHGRVAIGVSTTVADYWLPGYLASFVRQCPDVQPDIRVGNTYTISQALLDCRIDLALVEGSVDDSHIEVTPWRDDALMLVAAAHGSLATKRRITPVDLAACVWLMREQGSGTREVTGKFLEQHGVTPRTTIEIGSNLAIARAVAEDAGIAMLPAVVVEDMIALERIVRVPYRKHDVFSRPLFLLRLKGRPLSPAANAFLGLLAGADRAGAVRRRA